MKRHNPMKRILLTAVALLACLGQAEARDSLPQKFLGEWCRDSSSKNIGEEHREFGEKIVTYVREDNCTDHRRLLLTSYRSDMLDYICDIMNIKAVGKTIRVTQVCEYEGDTIKEVDVMWLDNKDLKIRPVSSKTIKREQTPKLRAQHDSPKSIHFG
jgi:hypothetical protein